MVPRRRHDRRQKITGEDYTDQHDRPSALLPMADGLASAGQSSR
jgi:hypothetical protein